MAGSIEHGPHEAQRHALGGLLARFTADRDALITSIQGCQDRIAELVARLDAAPRADAGAGRAPDAPPPVDLPDAIERLRRDLERRLDEVRATAVEAVEKAEAALGAPPPPLPPPLAGLPDAVEQLRSDLERRLHEVATAAGEALDKADAALGAVPPPLADLPQVVEQQRRELDRRLDDVTAAARQALEKAEAALDAPPPPVPPPLAGLPDAVEQLRSDLGRRLHEAATAAGEALDKADAALGAALGAAQQLAAAPEPAPASSLPEIRAAVAQLQDELARVQLAVEERREAELEESAERQAELAMMRVQVERLSADAAGLVQAQAVGDERVRAAVTALGQLKAELDSSEAWIESRIERLATPAGGAEANAPALWAAIEQLRNDLSRMESTMGDYFETIGTAAQGRDGELATLREQVERWARELDARMRAGAEAWQAEAKTLRAEMQQLAAAGARQGAAAADAADLRAALASLRADLGRIESAVETRLDGRMRSAVDSWTTEARLLRERVERLGATQAEVRAKLEHLAQRLRDHEPEETGLRALAATLRERLWAAVASLPGAGLASSVVESVAHPLRQLPPWR